MKNKRLFIRKPLNAKFNDGDEEHGLQRHLGPFQLTGIGIGAIIGAGIFVITGQAAALYAGPAIVISFLIAAFICTLAGLCYAELSALIPVSGGAYSYAYVALGELPAWIVGWSLIVQYLVSSATVAVGWSAYFTSFLRDLGLNLPTMFTQAPLSYYAGDGWGSTGAVFNLPAALLIVLVVCFICMGVKAATSFNNIMVFIKISIILLFIALGVWFIKGSNLTPFIPENTGHVGEFGWTGILRGAGLVFFAYIGFDTVATMAQEAKNPQKDLPKGILGSLAVSTVLYVLTALVLTGIAGYMFLNVPDPMSVALNEMGPSFGWLKILIMFAILTALASVVLVQLMGLTRIFFSISKDGLFPKQFGKLNPKTKTPVFGAVTIGIFGIVVAGLFPANVLGEIVSIAALFLFALVCLGVLVLRYRHPEFVRPFKVPFVPYVPVLGILACIAQMSFLPLVAWLQLSVWIALGLVIYFFYGLRHSKIRKEGKFLKEI